MAPTCKTASCGHTWNRVGYGYQEGSMKCFNFIRFQYNNNYLWVICSHWPMSVSRRNTTLESPNKCRPIHASPDPIVSYMKLEGDNWRKVYCRPLLLYWEQSLNRREILAASDWLLWNIQKGKTADKKIIKFATFQKFNTWI